MQRFFFIKLVQDLCIRYGLWIMFLNFFTSNSMTYGQSPTDALTVNEYSAIEFVIRDILKDDSTSKVLILDSTFGNFSIMSIPPQLKDSLDVEFIYALHEEYNKTNSTSVYLTNRYKLDSETLGHEFLKELPKVSEEDEVLFWNRLKSLCPNAHGFFQFSLPTYYKGYLLLSVRYYCGVLCSSSYNYYLRHSRSDTWNVVYVKFNGRM